VIAFTFVSAFCISNQNLLVNKSNISRILGRESHMRYHLEYDGIRDKAYISTFFPSKIYEPDNPKWFELTFVKVNGKFQMSESLKQELKNNVLYKIEKCNESSSPPPPSSDSDEPLPVKSPQATANMSGSPHSSPPPPPPPPSSPPPSSPPQPQESTVLTGQDPEEVVSPTAKEVVNPLHSSSSPPSLSAGKTRHKKTKQTKNKFKRRNTKKTKKR
jgi:hypothetical protein